jgi:hypothetical protein
MTTKQLVDRVLHGLAGAGPILFFLLATVEGSLRSDYDWIAQPISALAIGPRGWVQGVNFALLAASFFAFAAVLKHAFHAGAASRAAPIVLTIMTIGVVVAGLFPMDAALAPPSLNGKLHGLGGFLVFPCIPVLVLLLARRFRSDAEWRPFFRYTLAVGGWCLTLFVFFLLFVGPPTAEPRLASEFRGLVQRALLLPFFAWIALVVGHAHRATSRPSTRIDVHASSTI